MVEISIQTRIKKTPIMNFPRKTFHQPEGKFSSFLGLQKSFSRQKLKISKDTF
jgi:hypothetical protein